ncbi:N-terminal EF-hand calcium-binding protein 1 [Collichthys lucidus]|uniref:N-terminal EF-hand calcium-binding protein 1 n=1 Tax=Collichthys lucidus TaxID=240159 RepID=A0A4U5VJ74_COLLU|nr:N-terminal EF-hand calcium-binding protein 1 [Collichthys lucidus]
MDCSEEVQCVSEEPSAQMELKKGMSIFIDILRRADKNDDGKLSFDEFKAYFSDGVLTAEELKELFHTIDTHNTDNVDTDELCEYFSQHLGEYENVLAALEDLNMSILKAMDKTKKFISDDDSPVYKRIRFHMCVSEREGEHVRGSDPAAETSIHETASFTHRQVDTKTLKQFTPQGPLKPEVLSIQWSGRRSNRRLQRNSSLSPNNPLLSLINSGVYDEDSQWMIQVNRLQKLIDRLEQKEIRLEPVEEEVLESKSHILIVQRQLSVLEEELEEFRLALRQYMESACAQTGCLHIAVQRLANESRFILYEFWEHNNVWKNHLQTNYSKTFQRGNVDFLETPESVTTMLVPGRSIISHQGTLCRQISLRAPLELTDKGFGHHYPLRISTHAEQRAALSRFVKYTKYEDCA